MGPKPWVQKDEPKTIQEVSQSYYFINHGP